MPDATPEERVAGAEVALLAFEEDRGGRQFTSDEEWIGDLVADLLHLAASRRPDVERLLRCAHRDDQAEGGDARLDEPYAAHPDAHFAGKARAKLHRLLDWLDAKTLGDVVALSKAEPLTAPAADATTVGALARAPDRIGLELEPG